MTALVKVRDATGRATLGTVPTGLPTTGFTVLVGAADTRVDGRDATIVAVLDVVVVLEAVPALFVEPTGPRATDVCLVVGLTARGCDVASSSGKGESKSIGGKS